MATMTIEGARMILYGYYSVIRNREIFYREALNILGHLGSSNESRETIRVFINELELFLDELKTEASERQLSGLISEWNTRPRPVRFNHLVTEPLDPLSGPIGHWVPTLPLDDLLVKSVWAENGEN